jgi:hypothetical protein
MLEYLVFVSASATLLSAFVYIRLMFKGGAKPNRVSWLMWTIAPFIATTAAISSGVGWAVLPVFMAGFSPLLIFVASFVTKQSYWKLASMDYACGILSIFAIMLWLLISNPNVAIVLAIAGDALAAVPTLKKAWNHPNTESVWPYLTGVFSALTSYTVARLWTFSEYAFPTYLIVINTLLCLSVYHENGFASNW